MKLKAYIFENDKGEELVVYVELAEAILKELKNEKPQQPITSPIYRGIEPWLTTPYSVPCVTATQVDFGANVETRTIRDVNMETIYNNLSESMVSNLKDLSEKDLKKYKDIEDMIKIRTFKPVEPKQSFNSRGFKEFI